MAHPQKADEKAYDETRFESPRDSNDGGAHDIAQPAVVFEGKSEDRLYRKVDGRLLWILALLYLVAFLDRGK